MPFTLAVVSLAVLVSYARGGRLQRIADARLVRPSLLFAGLALQIGVDFAAGRGVLEDASTAGLTILLASQALVVAWLVLNRRLPGVAFVAVGLVMNAAVITANGAMPVGPEAMNALGLGDLEVPPGKHTLLTDATRLPWLADIIPLPPLRSIISAGDIVLALGLFPLTHALMPWRSEHDRGGARGVSGAPVS